MNTTATLTADQTGHLANTVQRLKRIDNKHTRWFAHCAAVQAGTAEYNIRLMPSKTSKWTAYELTREITNLLNINAPADIINTRFVWAWAIAQAS